MNFEVIEKQLDEAAVDSIVKSINIPPRPSLLEDIQAEMKKDDPEPRRIAAMACRDVAISAAVMRVVNSPFFSLSRRAETMEQAVAIFGLRPISSLVTGMVAREAIKGTGTALTRFWDVSTKRAYAVQHLARELRGVDSDLAQTFGLFCDVGIPLLMQRFPDYLQTLQAANDDTMKGFTVIERERHNTDHALVGALMARTWGLSQNVALGIRLHHDYQIFEDVGVPLIVRRLVAMGVLAERVIQRYEGLNHSVEWEKGGAGAMAILDMDQAEFDGIIDEIHDAFQAGV